MEIARIQLHSIYPRAMGNNAVWRTLVIVRFVKITELKRFAPLYQIKLLLLCVIRIFIL